MMFSAVEWRGFSGDGDGEEMDDVLVALSDGSLNVDAIITHEYPATDALQAFAVAADPEQSGKVLLSFAAES